jgi:acetyl esterase
MPDYDALLDEEVKAFLAKCAAFYPPDAVDLSIAEQRQVYDAMCEGFDFGRPDGVVTEDRCLGGLPCRLYEIGESAGTIVYFHGGGFVVGGLDSHDSICAEFCAGTGLRIISVDYRLSPEHPFPADFEDALSAYNSTLSDFEGFIILAGDSAGGNLAAAVAHKQRDDVRLRGMLLIYPGLGGAMTLPSYVRHHDAPGLTVGDIEFYAKMRTGNRENSGDPRLYPLHDADFSGLPQTAIVTAECDPLASDGQVYASKLSEAGVPVLWREEKGLVHGFLRARRMSVKAQQSFSAMIGALNAMAAGALPTG